MAQEPVADVEIQCLAEPGPVSSLPILQSLWVCMMYRLGKGCAAGMCLPSLWAACKVRLCVRRGDGRLLILGSNLILPENAVAEKQAPFLGL